MTTTTAAILSFVASLLLADPAHGQDRAPRPAEVRLVSAVDSMISTLPEMEARHRNVVAAADSMGALYRALSAGIAKVAESAASQEAGTLPRAIQALQEMNMSFSLQYLMLQQKMQDENRKFTLLSNIMKTKHDTARNAIQNVR